MIRPDEVKKANFDGYCVALRHSDSFTLRNKVKGDNMEFTAMLSSPLITKVVLHSKQPKKVSRKSKHYHMKEVDLSTM